MALPATVAALADTYYGVTATHAAQAANFAAGLWRSIPTDMSLVDGWQIIREPLLQGVAQKQVEAAVMSSAYMQAQAQAQGFELPHAPAPAAYVTPTDTADYWTGYSKHAALQAANTTGMAEVYARAIGLHILTRTVGALTLDTGREANRAVITSTPQIQGYYRKLRTPSCNRCAVLAGAYYRWSDGFLRHPNCDCEHVPAAEHDDSMAFDAFEAIRSGQITGLSEADRKAILEDGADVNQVINAKRGMRTTDIFGDRVQTTTEGTTRRGLAGRRLNGKVRLTPREIYRQAGTDRELAARLLNRHGYIF